MDRFLYVRYIVLIESRILARIGSNCLSFSCNFNTNTQIHLSSFWRKCRGLSMFYVNIDTKYISSTSNISFNLFVFNFHFLLFYFLIFSFLL